jgi:hypothetical protein
MDIRLRQIVSKGAGIYFIVTDKSQVANIETEAKMRLIFINVEEGSVNTLFKFAKGDYAGLTAMFGKGTRSQEKRGNFSIQTCLDALRGGPIAVVNLRKFTDDDKAGIVGLSPNIQSPESKTVEYSNLFNQNGFWVPEAENIVEKFTDKHVLNFGNIGTGSRSIIVTKAKSVIELTAEGEKSLVSSTLDIDEFPALDFDMAVKDTFVDAYVFANDFSEAGVTTNKYYGHLFNNDGNVDVNRIAELVAIPESGFIGRYTGSMIPGLKSETDTEISIESVMNSAFFQTGVICSINDELFETDNKSLLDVFGTEWFDETGTLIAAPGDSDYLLSHVVPAALTTGAVVFPPTTALENSIPVVKNLITYPCEKVGNRSFIGSFEQGIRIGDYIHGTDGKIVEIENLEVISIEAETGFSWTKVKYTCNGNVNFKETVVGEVTTHSVIKANPFVVTGLVKPFKLSGYTLREGQFTDGSATKQAEILDLINSPSIVKGLKGTKGIRYIVDAFKSFVEPTYKYQLGILMNTLDENNKFVRAIINEPFLVDLQKSTNPLFKQQPGGVFDWSYVPAGGNKVYSSKLLTKFVTGAEKCFFFGPGNVVKRTTKPIAGLISNLFYQKTFAFDVLANETGVVDGIIELEGEIDDNERADCEKFRYNPIINITDGVYTIYGNLSGQYTKTAQQQIHNSELLAFVKENLLNLSKSEAFKKGNYDDYLRTETMAKNFMDSLALAGAIEANPIVICNASNNTREIAKNKIKLVHIEYTPIDALDKVVFDLQIN